MKITYKPGDHVRLVLPGSRQNGITGRLKHPRSPAGWWTIETDRPLEREGDSSEPTEDRNIMAPELWFERYYPKKPRAKVQATLPLLGRRQGNTR